MAWRTQTLAARGPLPSNPEQNQGLQEAREKRVEKKLKKLGANIVHPHVSALVNGGEGTHRKGCRRNIQADRSQHGKAAAIARAFNK
jgi:hypothetical protein